MNINFLIAALTALIGIVIVSTLVYVFKTNKKVKELTSVVTDYLPTLIEATTEILNVAVPEHSEKINIVETVVKQAVQAVEQISKTEELSSDEKKNLAIEFYEQIAAHLNLKELTELEMKTLEILIENAVFELDKIIEKKDPALDEKVITLDD